MRSKWALLCVLWFLSVSSSTAALENQLRHHPSPYLAMHSGDPVAWQDWGPEVVALAREQGKLLFISSGYFSCHWCHVMQRESYQNPAIAELLNSALIPVKLDRELHSALDAYLIDFMEKTQGHAGWPLNIFITPEGYPLIGLTYLPPEEFKEVLTRLTTQWLDEREKLRNLARRTHLKLLFNEQTETAAVDPMPTLVLRDRMRDQALAMADTLEGGFGDQNKFPMVPQLNALLTQQAAAPDPQIDSFLRLTLDKMASEGLRDHLAGGFYRYTVDPSWQIPHYEKMLYTQAQLAGVYLRAAEIFEGKGYARVARDTLEFVLRAMSDPQGGFVASFSAVDGAGEEGGVYLWTVDQLHQLLGEHDTALARRYWRMHDLSMLDGSYLPRRGETIAQIAETLDQDEAELGARIETIRQRLLQARAGRELPVDGKVLAGWNGLMLAVLSQAARRWSDDRLREAATRLRDYLKNQLWDGSALRRAVSKGKPIGRASLADYAYVAQGMAQYAELSGDPKDQTFVAVLLNLAWQRYYGEGGWRADDEPLLPGMAEQPAMQSGALAAPSAILIRLALRSDDPQLVEIAHGAIDRARARTQEEPFWYAGHFEAQLGVSD